MVILFSVRRNGKKKEVEIIQWQPHVGDIDIQRIVENPNGNNEIRLQQQDAYVLRNPHAHDCDGDRGRINEEPERDERLLR